MAVMHKGSAMLSTPSTLSFRALPALILAALTAGGAVAADKPAAPAAAAVADATDEGLVPAKAKNVDKVWQRPGTPWESYTKVMLAPVGVSFSRSWNPRDFGRMGLRVADIERIRSQLAQLTTEVFAKVLGEGGYTVVQASGEGVLQVKPDIMNLLINAPDTMQAGSVRSYVLEAGSMTRVLELRDSVTGTVLARARDRKRGTDNGQLQWASSVFNRTEAERALRGWAMQLKNELDAARKSG